MPKEDVKPAALRRLLDSGATERQLQLYIRRHPWILYWTLCPASGHSRYTLPGFPLGARYKTDFAILNSYSGAYEVTFVEFEPPADQAFTKAGTPSKRLAGAIKQIDDWRAFFGSNQVEVRHTLKDWATRKDVLGYSKSAPFNYAAQDFLDPATPLLDHYLVVIGRSTEQLSAIRSLAGRFGEGHDLRIMSYDRLLHLAEQRYGPGKNTPGQLPNIQMEPTRQSGCAIMPMRRTAHLNR